MNITKTQAREFMRDLRGTVYGDPNKANGGIMREGLVADHMKMSIEKANQFLNACIKYGITERQGGAYVI